MTASQPAAADLTGVHAPSFRTVLCAVDFSDHSRAALYLAAGLTAAPGCKLVVVLVDERAHGEEKERLKADFQLQAFVRGALPGFASYREALTCLVMDGDPADAILQAAATAGANLIVVGTRGRSSIKRAFFGSTTSTLLRKTTVPLAIVPPAHPEVVAVSEAGAVSHFGIVLVPIDLREEVQRQLEFAGTLSPGSEHRLLLMTVVPPGADRDTPFAQLRNHASSVTTARGCRLLVKEGEVAESVLSVLHHEPVGLVVLGQSGGHPGKVASELVRHAGAVVVVVP